MPMFSRFKNKGAHPTSKDKNQVDASNGNLATPQKPRYQSTWTSKAVVPEEVEELIHACTTEMKSRAEALNAPFLLLPFRPHSDAAPARTFISNFFKANAQGLSQYTGEHLQRELRLTEPAILCSIIKWCWARIPHGVVSWPVYEGFQIGEKECKMARNAFDTFIPISAETNARKNIIVDFFDLLAAVAAYGKTNGMGGRKLSRQAGWWAFEHLDDGSGFESGYKTWSKAADASSHMFFAYLRSLSPDTDPSLTVIERIPRSLQALIASTEYPPERPSLLHSSTPKVVMLVENVSPTPFALLRRAKHFEYRDSDKLLRQYSEYDDPVEALTEECKRVLQAVSTINSKAIMSNHEAAVAQPQESWSAFSNMGFLDMDTPKSASEDRGVLSPVRKGFNSMPASRHTDMARPTTPSWADFTSSGFVDDGSNATALILPPDQVLPPIGGRAHSSSAATKDQVLAPGELAAITLVELDDAFWWVWMTSLAAEEPMERKAVFGRCALVETRIMNGHWLIIEEQLKGLSNEATEGMVVVQKKSLFGLSRRSRRGSKHSRVRNTDLAPPTPNVSTLQSSPSRTSLAPDQTSRIKAAAAELTRRQSIQGKDAHPRREDDGAASYQMHRKIPSGIVHDASPAMKWASAYDQNALTEPEDGSILSAPPKSASSSESARAPPSAPGPLRTNVDPTSLSPVVEDHDIPSLPPKDSPVEAGLAPGAFEPADASPVSAVDERDVVESAPLNQTVSTEEPVAPSSPMQNHAASIPLSPTKSIERKPVPQAQEDPALRPESQEDSTVVPSFSPTDDSSLAAEAPSVPRAPSSRSPTTQDPATHAAQLAMGNQTSLESRFHDAKAKKQTGGLKKLFSRSKDTGAAPQESGFGRRISIMRKKQPSQNAAANRSTSSITQQPTVPEYPSEPLPVAAARHAHNTRQAETNAQAPADTDDEIEDADPHYEFGRFDQGPMEDMPGMVPQDSDSDLVPTPVAATPTPAEHNTPEPTRHFETDLASRIAPPQVQPEPVADTTSPKIETPEMNQQTFSPVRSSNSTSPGVKSLASRFSPKPVDNGREIPEHTVPKFSAPKPTEHNTEVSESAASETTIEEQPRPAPLTQDRWATIRENAAKRAAAAQANDQTEAPQGRRSESTRTDDGETSGEETIESRVARIKARVAELTGGMESNMPPRRNF